MTPAESHVDLVNSICVKDDKVLCSRMAIGAVPAGAMSESQLEPKFRQGNNLVVLAGPLLKGIEYMLTSSIE